LDGDSIHADESSDVLSRSSKRAKMHLNYELESTFDFSEGFDEGNDFIGVDVGIMSNGLSQEPMVKEKSQNLYRNSTTGVKLKKSGKTSGFVTASEMLRNESSLEEWDVHKDLSRVRRKEGVSRGHSRDSKHRMKKEVIRMNKYLNQDICSKSTEITNSKLSTPEKHSSTSRHTNSKSPSGSVKHVAGIVVKQLSPYLKDSRISTKVSSAFYLR
jgi:hypothetical protein